MATLDGQTVALGDSVYDVLYGPGRVVELRTSGLSVKFATRANSLSYNEGGVSARFPQRSLYWRDPVIVPPLKNDAHWAKLGPIIRAVIDAFSPRTQDIN